jgi:hypothetical protein
MALSTQVKESIQLATNHLRDALAFASRSEHSHHGQHASRPLGSL